MPAITGILINFHLKERTPEDFCQKADHGSVNRYHEVERVLHYQ